MSITSTTAPRALTYNLSQFMGEFADTKAAVMNHVAQSRALGHTIDLKVIFERLEVQLRREVEIADTQHKAFWREQYHYVRGVLSQLLKPDTDYRKLGRELAGKVSA